MTNFDGRWGIGCEEGLADDDAVTLVVSKSGRAAFFPRSISRHPDEVVEIAADLQQASARVAEAIARVEALVWEGRQAGLSWDAIGWCTGIVGRTASVKWGDLAAGPPPGDLGRE